MCHARRKPLSSETAIAADTSSSTCTSEYVCVKCAQVQVKTSEKKEKPNSPIDTEGIEMAKQTKSLKFYFSKMYEAT